MSTNKLSDIFNLIGNTPIINLQSNIFAKMENYNLSGSIKDRVALQMILDLEKEGKLFSITTIIEPTSGNTGIGLAAICAAKNLKLIIVMPKTMSKERVSLIKAYGARLEFGDDMSDCIHIAEEICNVTPNSVIAGQFKNPSNPKAHYLTTGPEIWKQTGGNIDYFVSAVGTGGTITGVGQYLKEKNPDIKIIAVEPKNSAVLSGGTAGSHKIQGIGAGFVPDVLDENIYDDIIMVSDEKAYSACHELSEQYGLFVGISSGANYYACKQLDKTKKIVTVFPDGGDRYLSTDLWTFKDV